MTDLVDEVALVTGRGSGLREACAALFAQRGALRSGRQYRGREA